VETRTFTQKQIVYLVIPLIIEQLLTTVVGVIDTMMVSSIGEAAVSGVSLVDNLNRIAIFLFNALATSGTIVAAQYIGMRDLKKARNSGHQVFAVTLLLSLVIGTVCIIFRQGILSALFGSVAQDVMKNAVTYLILTAASYPFLAIGNICSALFRSCGNSKLPMIISLIVNIINTALNALFIYVLDMGVFGAALATLIARAAGAAVLTAKLCNPSQTLNISGILHYRPNGRMIKRILQLGIPTGVENGMFEGGKLILNSLISTFGTASIAANTVANNINSIVYTVGAAVGMALMTVVGQCVGAGRIKEAKYHMIRMTLSSMALMIIINALILLFRGQIVSIYGFSAETAKLAKYLLILCGVGTMAFWAPAYVLPNGLRAAGEARFTMIIGGVSLWVIRVAFGYILSVTFKMGVAGIWYAMTADGCFRSIVYVWRLASNRWMNHKIIDRSELPAEEQPADELTTQ
jgi:putative MATE family efflux protein